MIVNVHKNDEIFKDVDDQVMQQILGKKFLAYRRLLEERQVVLWSYLKTY